MLGIVHDMGGQRVEGEEISHFFLLLAVHNLSLTDYVCVDNLVPRQEVVLHLFVSVVELHYEFAG